MGFKAANRESFPYIIHIVDEPQKFSPSNVLTYTVCNVLQNITINSLQCSTVGLNTPSNYKYASTNNSETKTSLLTYNS